MRSQKKYVKWQKHMNDDDGDPDEKAPDDEVNWEYTCKSCVAKELEISEKDAEVQIKEQEGPRSTVQRDTGVEKYDELLKQFKKESDFNKSLMLMEQLEKIEDELENSSKNMAFQSLPDQQQCVNVAQYHDEWTMSKSGSRMRAWYVCMSDGNGLWEPCGTIMPAKHWHRRFEDVGCSKQRWYCVCCGKRYLTKYGMLVEIHITSPEPTSVFMRSEITNQDVDDVRGLYLEDKLEPKDHKDLWEKIPDFIPMEPGDIMRPCREQEFAEREGFQKDLIYKFHKPEKVEDEVPKWDWDQIFTLVGGKPK
jgi:hypothetical protein